MGTGPNAPSSEAESRILWGAHADVAMTRLETDLMHPALLGAVRNVLALLEDDPGRVELRRHRFQNGLWAVAVSGDGQDWVLLWEPSEEWFDIHRPYCHCDAMSMTKAERLQIRVDPTEKRLLERAAEVSHLSVSAFVLQSAAAQAAAVLADRQLIVLSAEAAAAFGEALEAPAAVNRRLATAMDRPRKFRWLD